MSSTKLGRTSSSTRTRPGSLGNTAPGTTMGTTGSVMVCKPTKRMKDQNEYYTTHGFVIIGMLPFIPRHEREMVERWMAKLETMNKNDEERRIRNDYVWFLLVQLENGAVTLPFVQPPPEGRLAPVAKSVDKAVYEEILQAANKRASRIEDEEINKQPDVKTVDFEGLEEEDPSKIKPEEFLNKQPVPKFGFIVYGSCFSDQSVGYK
ncbi:unnamed protein product [Hermetia illucens]|uniref:DUF4485 domain-containing protein n=1 Tax=Hermetia illucens TaxID=343691 RepID=A0A7R8Z539_HERIL|nr:uncharacterized protein LOC119659838 [Hermetia illucens]CAD7093692.1 unnamed protein product [Hermetia illucens]